MAIPKQIFQTFKTKKLPWLTRVYISRFRKKNPEYQYFIYDDNDILNFFSEEFPEEYLNAYKRLTIGAAKADFFRYAILYKKGGVYLDVDSGINKPLHKIIKNSDTALICREDRHPEYFLQWALIFDKGHPFLKKTLEMILDNIKTHRYPKNIHATTGPAVFTAAVLQCIEEDSSILYRIADTTEFHYFFRFKYKLGKFFLYPDKSEHWKKKQQAIDIIKPE